MRQKLERYNEWNKLIQQLETFPDCYWDWRFNIDETFLSKIANSDCWIVVTTDAKVIISINDFHIPAGVSDVLLHKAVLQTQNNERACNIFKNLTYEIGREVMKNNVQVETYMLPENETSEDDLNFNREELETMARNIASKKSDEEYFTRSDLDKIIDALVDKRDSKKKKKPSKEDIDEINEFNRKMEKNRQEAYIGKGCGGTRRMNV